MITPITIAKKNLETELSSMLFNNDKTRYPSPVATISIKIKATISISQFNKNLNT